MEDITVHKLTSQDINSAIELLYRHASTLIGFRELLRYCLEKDADGFVAVHCGAVIGIVAGHLEENKNSVALDMLCVHTQFRRRGLARRLIDRFVEHFGADKSYNLEVRESNALAQSVYDRWGFLLSGRKALYYPNEDALTMTR